MILNVYAGSALSKLTISTWGCRYNWRV